MFRILASMFLLVGVVTFVSLQNQASAQNSASSIKMSPTLQELVLEPGQSRTIDFEIENIADSSQTVSVAFYDFTPEITGEPKLLTDSTRNDAYGISSWLSSVDDINLVSLGRKTVSVQIAVPPDTSPATYYGAVVFRTVSAAQLPASVASLVFVDVGEPSINLSDDVTTDVIRVNSEGATGVPESLSLQVNSTADYRFTPEITLQIVGEDGTVIETIASDKSGSILPNSTRVFSFEITQDLDPTKSYSARSTIVLPDGQTLESMSDSGIYQASQPAEDETDIVPEVPAAIDEDSKQSLLPGVIGGIIASIFIIVILVIRSLRKSKRERKQSAPSAADIVSPTPPQTSLTQNQPPPSSNNNDPTNNRQL